MRLSPNYFPLYILKYVYYFYTHFKMPFYLIFAKNFLNISLGYIRIKISAGMRLILDYF